MSSLSLHESPSRTCLLIPRTYECYLLPGNLSWRFWRVITLFQHPTVFESVLDVLFQGCFLYFSRQKSFHFCFIVFLLCFELVSFFRVERQIKKIATQTNYKIATRSNQVKLVWKDARSVFYCNDPRDVFCAMKTSLNEFQIQKDDVDVKMRCDCNNTKKLTALKSPHNCAVWPYFLF